MRPWLAVCIAATMAAGCASTISGTGHAIVSSSEPASFPPTSSTTAVSPIQLPPSTSTPAPPRLRDITHIAYTTPSGFVLTTNYHPVTPLEAQYVTHYFVPSNERNGLDVLSLTLYLLPRAGLASTPALQRARVATYNRKTSARVLAGPTLTAVGGRPAWEETAIEQSIYKYVAFYVFGTRHVLVVSCQVDKQPQTISKGCQQLVASLDLS